MDIFIKGLGEQKRKSDETIKLNMIKAFKIFKNTIVMDAFTDFEKYQQMISKQLYLEVIPEIIYVNSIIISEDGGETMLIMDRIKPMTVLVDGKRGSYRVDGNYVFVSIPPKPKKKKDDTISLQMYFNKKEIRVPFPLIYVSRSVFEANRMEILKEYSKSSDSSYSPGNKIKSFEFESGEISDEI